MWFIDRCSKSADASLPDPKQRADLARLTSPDSFQHLISKGENLNNNSGSIDRYIS